MDCGTNDDLITALRLEDAGCVAVMPLASPIGSGLGVVNPYFIREIKSRLEVPVISVGNLSVGGTGKTPMVCWLVDRLRAAGCHPAVVARGYGRAEGASLNDEGMLLDARFESLIQVQDPDRVAAARRAIGQGVRGPHPKLTSGCAPWTCCPRRPRAQ